MFGTYRFILAGLVILTHLGPLHYHRPGIFAVFSFYMVSGYLMTYILNEKYGFSVSGLGRYLLNRVLRIYPIYWICAGCALIFAVAFPWLTWQVHRSIVMPTSLMGWFSNFTLFGIMAVRDGAGVPQAWSLIVEMLFYLCLGVFLARNKYIVGLWFALSVVYTIYLNIAGIPRYNTFLAASLPFSIGALIYFSDEFKKTSWIVGVLSVCLYIANLVVSVLVTPNEHFAGFYTSVFISALVLVSLKGLDKKTIPTWIVKLDETAGNLSYPMYMSHFLIGIVIVLTFFPNFPKYRGWDFFFLSLGYIILFSYILHRYIERPINRLRENVKGAEVRDRRVNRTVVSSTFITKNGDQSRA